MLTKVTQLSPRWRPLLITAMLTGLRPSELRGLTWSAVDLDAKALEVRQRADRFNRIGAPKSRAGRREVPLSRSSHRPCGYGNLPARRVRWTSFSRTLWADRCTSQIRFGSAGTR
jgi:hypothetical protein